MRIGLLLMLLVPFVWTAMHPVNQEIVEKIKRSTTSWTPLEPEENPFFYMPIERIKSMMGLKLPIYNVVSQPATDISDSRESFDARAKWGSKIHPIRNQGNCDAAWAYSTVDALSDRFSIAGQAVTLSPQHIID